MTDFAVTPFQPIVQGVVTFPDGPGVGTPVVFTGEGISDIERPTLFTQGAYILTLDAGLPGNSGAVPPGTTLINNPNVRSMITARGAGTPPFSGVAAIAVLYLLSPDVGVGSDQILVTMQTVPPAALIDPAGGFEIIVWVVED